MGQRIKKEVTYRAPWPVYAMHWSQRPGSFRLGIGSFIETPQGAAGNKLQVIQTMNRNGDFVKVAETNLTFPVSKLMWHPAQASAGPDLFVTSGDYLRIWELITPEDVVDCETDTGLLGGSLAQTDLRQIGCRAMLANIRKSGSSKKESCAPLTSLDWNEKDPRLCVTCSVDTTCTVWDLNTQQSKTQLIAHDKEVFDVAFSNSVDVFASVSADGSVRMFDLRALDHSTIIYETSAGISPPSGAGTHSAVAAASNPGLLRLAWNKQDSNYLATFQQESGSVLILDVRSPAVPATELHGHGASVSCIGWAPHSSEHICTAGDDAQAFVWDLSQSHRQKVITTPLLSFTAELPINNLSWSARSSDWVAFSHGSCVQALKV